MLDISDDLGTGELDGEHAVTGEPGVGKTSDLHHAPPLPIPGSAASQAKALYPAIPN